MAVRKQCNRYKTEPSGDHDFVVKRAKQEYRDYEAFTLWKSKKIENHYIAFPRLQEPSDTIEKEFYKWNRNIKRWEQVNQ